MDSWAKGGNVQKSDFGHFGHLVRLQITRPRTMGVTEKCSSLPPGSPAAGGRIALNHLPDILKRSNRHIASGFSATGPRPVDHPQDSRCIYKSPEPGRRRRTVGASLFRIVPMDRVRRRDAQPTLSCLRSRTAATVELTLLGPAHFERWTATLKAGTRTPSCATQTTYFSTRSRHYGFIHKTLYFRSNSR